MNSNNLKIKRKPELKKKKVLMTSSSFPSDDCSCCINFFMESSFEKK